MKAIEKDRARRYETANAFARDVRRFLEDEPVTAVAPSASYRVRKFARRNRAALGIAAVIALLFVAIAGSTWQAVRATRAEQQSAHTRKMAVEFVRDLEEQQAKADKSARNEFNSPADGRHNAVLERFIGTWDVQVTVKPAGGEESTFSAVTTRTWSQRGTFIHFDDPNFERPQEPDFQMLLTYDPGSKNYPGVMMSGSSRSEITGNWDERSQTMHFTAPLADGNRLVSSHRFIDQDHAEPHGVIKNPEGDVVIELAWRQTRRKADSETGPETGWED